MKIKIMKCSWSRNFEGKTLEVQKVTSEGPTTRELILQLIKRFDNLVAKNNLKE